MKHLSEKQIVALVMGYADPKAAAHANSCAACHAGLNAWQRTLHTADAVSVPEAPDAAQVWQHIAGQLQNEPPRRRRALLVWPAWVAVAAVCIAVAGLRLLRPHPAPQPAVAAVPQPSPVLRFAVAQHLDRTQVLLVEMAHANEMNETPGHAVDLSLEKSSARDLLNANRLYDQSASLQGDAMMAHVLSSLEPPLLEIVHSPNEVPPAAWRAMQHRIAHSGVLFKVRVLDQTLHAQHGAL